MAARQQQLEVLTALDRAKTQWYHFTAIVVAGMGFFTDAYDLFCISTVTKLLGRIYYTDMSGGAGAGPGVLPPNVSAAVNGVAFCGTLAGQLFFGWLGDKLGRKRAYSATLACMVASSLACGLSLGTSARSVLASLCFFRFWLGFGIGGDYPLSATIMSEYANKRTRGAFIAAVFAMQGFGILGGAAIAILVSAAFDHAYPAPSFAAGGPAASTPPQADLVWRIILMMGAVPAALTYYWRMKMPETARYTALVAGDAKRAAADMTRVLDMEPDPEEPDSRLDRSHQLPKKPSSSKDPFSSPAPYGLVSTSFLARHGLHLLGTTSTWFLLDVAFYSQNLFQKDVFSAVGWLPPARRMSALEEVFRISRAQALIALCSTVPGYWFTVLLIDRIGRFTIQLLGFFMMTAFMLALAIPYDYWRGAACGGAAAAAALCHGHHTAFVVLYAFTFFFSNFGPNSTTFIVPAEVFPARLRSTCHGISAAAGKAGAIVGAFGFLYAAQDPTPGKQEPGYPNGLGIRTALIMLACCNALGFCFTFLVPETKGRSLEEITGESGDAAVVDDDGGGIADVALADVHGRPDSSFDRVL